ncbi:hypothetical protein MUB24_10095 [Lederbergia sp. NSJ-179]|uniref:hypothetical protein n=1 Tax=Lederbergia sp. NSJ-179 TaxID=2931402 RepID=UPI001FD3FB3D|nr:hypothetical protein [Lederbergia sp. NSJ-179]MCJ7841243.1 hypothetical protein [Lederbergia sp. NSJ-179]
MNLLESKIPVYFSSILAGFAVIGLLFVPNVSDMLGPVSSILMTMSVILVLLFAAAIILKGLFTLFRSFIKQ